nr:integrase core domain-containing protein [Neisseria yangbaofengii]
MKRLAKVEKAIEEKLKEQAKRHNKSSPGEMVHFDTKRRPLLQNQKATDPRDYMFVAIREPYAAVLPDRTAADVAKFLLHDVIDYCAYTIECAHSDNGMEYRGNASHPFAVARVQNNIGQKFARIARPQTNGKAERGILTLMEMWHDKFPFKNSEDRQKELCRFVNFYNTVKPHKGLKGVIRLLRFYRLIFPTCCVNNATVSYILDVKKAALKAAFFFSMVHVETLIFHSNI